MAEQRLRTLLEDASAGVPAPNLAAVALEGARRRRMRRRLASVAAVSAVVVALGAALVTSPELPGRDKPVPAGPVKNHQAPTSSPSSARVPNTVADLPNGDPPELPYTINDTLYLGGVSTSLQGASMWLRVGGDSQKPGPGGASILTWAETKTSSPIRLLRGDGRKTTVLDPDAGSAPVVSVDGRLAAWQTSSSGPAEAVVWDLFTLQEVARKTFPFTPSCCDNPFDVVGIDASGRVFATGAGGAKTWVWDSRRGSLRRVRGLGPGYPVVDEATTDGVAVSLLDLGDSPISVVGQVDAHGTFVEQVRVRGVLGTVSWDGSRLAYVGGGESLRVRDLSTGGEQVMNLPANTYVKDLIWETSKTVLVVVGSPDKGPDAWVRCFADTDACELAALLKSSYMVARR